MSTAPYHLGSLLRVDKRSHPSTALSRGTQFRGVRFPLTSQLLLLLCMKTPAGHHLLLDFPFHECVFQNVSQVKVTTHVGKKAGEESACGYKSGPRLRDSPYPEPSFKV